MFVIIERSSDAVAIMTCFVLNLINKDETNRDLNFKLKSIAKDMDRGLLECAFEEIETLPAELKEKVPASYHALFGARRAYCSAPMEDDEAAGHYQLAIDCVINEACGSGEKIN
jgi:hypothetical protein